MSAVEPKPSQGVLTIDNGTGWDEIVAMPRPLRVPYPSAIYHLMNCGDHCEPTFRDDIDRPVSIPFMLEK